MPEIEEEFPLSYKDLSRIDTERISQLERSPTFDGLEYNVPHGMRTLYSTLHRIAEIFPNRLGFSQRTCLPDGRPGGYESFSYRQTLHRVKRLARGLAEIGCGNGTHLAVLGPSCFAWLLMDFATSAIGDVLIPLYDNWSVDTLNYVVKHCDASVIILHPSLSGRMNIALNGDVKTLIIMDLDDRSRRWSDSNPWLFLNDENKLLNEQLDKFENKENYNINISLYTNSISPADGLRIGLELIQHGVKVIRMSQLLELGSKQTAKELPKCSKPNDVHSIVYTSGTSGIPKGAMLSEYTLMQSAWGMVVQGAFAGEPEFIPKRKGHPEDPVFVPKPDSMASYETYIIPNLTSDVVTAMTNDFIKNRSRFSGISNIPVPPSYLCMLPLAHVFERTTTLTAMMYLTRIHFLSGYNYDYDPEHPEVIPRHNNVGSMLKDIPSVVPGPCIMVTVPRLLEKIKEGVETKMAKPFPGEKVGFLEKMKRALIRLAVNDQMKVFKKTSIISTKWKGLVLNKIKALLSKDLKLVIVGGSAIEGDVMDFFRAIFDIRVAYGYGMTESAGCIAASVPSKMPIIGPNTQGYGVGHNIIRLFDRPDLAYTKSLNNSGEVIVAGVPLFNGYYKDREATEKAIVMETIKLKNGKGETEEIRLPFYKTGDIGTFQPDGTLLLVDRANNIFKLSQGEFIIADKIESAYVGGLIAQIVIAGGSTRSEIVGIIVVDKNLLIKALKRKAEKEGKEMTNVDDNTLEGHESRSLLFADMIKKAADAKLLGYETIRSCVFTFDEFSVQNSLLTASMKIRRHEVIKKYSDYIDALYDMRSKIGEPGEDGSDVSAMGIHNVRCGLLTHGGRVLISAARPVPEAREEVFAKQ